MIALAFGLLLIHLTLGLIFLAHGAQKLFGVSGGHGLQGTIHMIEMLGLHPAKWWAIAAAGGEFIGGLLMALGLFTPLAALLIASAMLVAIIRAHVPKGFWNSQGGYEYPLVLFIVALALGVIGAGPYSLDGAIGFAALNPAWFIVGLLFLVILGLVTWLPSTSWVQKHWHALQP
ncbi:MAG TPA: DoxX family protein [Ktedonobacteraceae bacterium]|jgi:putative oxidoreductase|nr:DoxX family protein [Ktedonobacteraceae bacterium]